MIPLAGFMPDAPAGTKGAITGCANLVPTSTGMAPGPQRSLGSTFSSGTATGAFISKNTRGIARLVVATAANNVFEATSAGWQSVSAIAGGNEGVAFATFGNALLASSSAANVSASVYSAAVAPAAATAFAVAAGSPRANILVAAKNFVLAFDTDEALFGVSRDRWWCSAFQDALSWTINPVTQANTGRLVGTPGPITAAAMLGDVCVAYKETGAYIGREAGPPFSWQWDDVESHFGCVGKRAVCDVEGAHFVVGPDDVWLFDGTRPISVAEGKVKNWLFRGSGSVAHEIDDTYRSKTVCVYERANTRVWVFYVQAGSTTGELDSAVVYSVRTGKWGRANRAIQCALSLEGAAGQHLGSLPFYASGIAAFFSDDLQLYIVSDKLIGAVPDASTIEVADVGDDFAATYVRSVLLNYNRRTLTAVAQGFTRDELTGPSTFRQTQTQERGRFNIKQDGRFHWFRFNMAGDYEVDGYTIDSRSAGRK